MWRIFLLVLLCLLTAPAAASTVYKCIDAHGHTSYQDTPCPHARRQQVVHLADTSATASTAPPVMSRNTPPSPEPLPAPPARRPLAPPPVLFRCTRATDGSTYLSRTGRTRSYLVPSGMLDWNRPLAEVYGSRQGKGVGMSAPELMPDPTPQMIGGGNFVQVRDVCRQLPLQAACDALRTQYEANGKAIEHAFRSDRAPLRKKRRELQTRLRGCPG